MAQPLYMRGEKRKLIDGREVTVLEKVGDAWKVLTQNGKLELVYPRQFKAFDAMKGA
jgi:hypothetical protein